MNRIYNVYSTGEFQQPSAPSKLPVPFALAKIATTTGLIFLHECGHALAASLLYRNANPEIRFSFFNGYCRYDNSKLSELGKHIGPANASALVAAAGPMIDMIALLAITKLSHSNKTVARLLATKAFGLSLYALSAFWKCDSSHDFCNVWSKSGVFAYGALTACCLATTALVMKNAFSENNASDSRNIERSNALYRGNRQIRFF